jgi:hypothetical protein
LLAASRVCLFRHFTQFVPLHHEPISSANWNKY